MNVRRSLVLAGGAAAVLAAAILFGRLGATDRVCPAVGWGYVGDVELVFSVPPQSVAACFGERCTRAPVAASAEGRWLVPQSLPYVTAPASVTAVFVEAASSSGGHTAGTFPIKTESTGQYPFGRECGGPYRFKPVKVTLGKEAAAPGRCHRFDGGLPESSFQTSNRHGTIESGPGHRFDGRRATRGNPALRCCQAAVAAR